jgi:F0F1-type ATP synthase assembly protein I
VSHGTELAGGLLVFFLIGLGLDAWLGTRPLFMICLSVFAAIGSGVRLYYAYTVKMQKLEDERRNNSSANNSSVASASSEMASRDSSEGQQ